VRPVTFHEYPVVLRVPKSTYSRLAEGEQRINETYAAAWVRD